MLKAPLSELSRGKGEKRGSYVEVVYEDKDLFKQIGLSKQDKKENIELKTLPKTYTTRKGELCIFSEDLNSADNNDGSKFSSSIRDFRRNVLDFGSKSSPPLFSSREDTIDSFSHLLTEQDLGLSYYYDKVRPGYSAKRYLAHWTRNWKPDLINKFGHILIKWVQLYKDGKLKDESLFEIMSQRTNDRFRLDDDLTRIPPVYKIQRNWLEMNVEMFKGYQFYRTDEDQIDNFQEPKEELIDEIQTIKPEKSNNIQVVDKEGNKVKYSNLSRADQETVLAELLIQTALKTMNDSNDKTQLLTENNETITRRNNNSKDKSKIKEFKPLDISTDSNPSSYIFPALGGNKLSSLTKPQNTVKLQTKNINKNSNDRTNNPFNDRSDNLIEHNIKTQNQSQNQDHSYFMNHLSSEENKELKSSIEEIEHSDNNRNNKAQASKIRLENALPKVSNWHKSEPKPHTKHDSHHESKLNIKKDHEKGVIVIGPDGKPINVGKTLLYESNSVEPNRQNQEGSDEVVYRLFDKIPPYLYYTNKLEGNVRVSYDDSINDLENNVKVNAYSKRDPSKPTKAEQSPRKSNAYVPIINKNLIKALISHAQKIAKLALEADGSGSDLAKDVEAALSENLKNQEPKETSFKDSLKKSWDDLFKQSNEFSNIEIDDYVLANILEFPPNAFEIVVDPKTKKKIVQIKKSFKDKFLLEQKTKAKKNLMSNDVKMEETQGENFHSQKGSQYRKKDSDSIDVKKPLSNNDDETEISANIIDELRDEVKLESIQLRRESKIHLPSIDTQHANSNDPIMKVERMHFEEKLRRRSSRHSITGDMINLMNMKFASTIAEKNEKPEEDKSSQKKSNEQKKDESKQEIKASDEGQSDSKKRKKNRNAAAKNAMKSKSTGDVSTLKKDEIEDDLKRTKKSKSKKPEQKKVFKFGQFKDDMSIKNTFDPSTIAPQPPAPAPAAVKDVKKRKKESKSKKKLIAEVTSQLEKRRLEKKEEAANKQFKPLNPVNEEDFEGVDLNQLERLNMQEVMFTKIVDPQDVRDYKRRQIIEEKKREIERRRQEQEEEKRRQQEEAARREKAERELAEEMKRREDELRLKRMADAAKKRKNADAEAEKKRLEEMQAELERKAREDYAKKMEEMRIKFIKEMRLKAKQDEERRQEEERKRREEETRLQEMSEQDKFDYLRRKREAEEAERIRLEEEQRQRQEEMNRAFEEAKRIAAEEATRKAALEKKLAFSRSVREERSHLNASQSVTRAFTFSYYELLKYLADMEKENIDPSLQPKETDIRKPTGPSINDPTKTSK